MAFGGLKKWFEDRAKNVANVGSRAFDQINTFDNNRTWEQRTPTQTKSSFQQLGQLGGQTARGTFSPIAKTINTGLAAGNVGLNIGKTAGVSLFGTDQGYQDAVASMDRNNNRFIPQGSGLLGTGSWFKNKNEATNIGTKDLAGRIAGAGAETYLAGKSLKMGGFAGKELINQGLKQGLRSQLPTIAKNAALNAAQGGVSALNQGGNIRDIAKSAAIGGALGTAGDVGFGLAGAGIQKVATPALNAARSIQLTPLNQGGFIQNPLAARTGLQINNPLNARQGLQINNPLNAKSKPLEVNNPMGATGIPLKVQNNTGNKLVGEGLSGAAQQSWLSKIKNSKLMQNEGGYIQLPGKGDKLDAKAYADTFGVTPEQAAKDLGVKGFVAKESKVRGGRKDTVRIKNTPEGLKRTLQTEGANAPGPTPQSSMTPLGDINNPLPVNPQALDLKNKAVKKDFMDSTNRHLGSISAARTNNTVVARSLPKLDTNQSMGLMDAVQQGVDTGDFSGAPAQVRGILDAKYQQLRDAGVDIGYLQDYFPQKWQNASADEVNRAYQVLNMKAGIMQPRTIPTIQEGIALGYKPLTTDYRQAVANYLNTADKLIANRQYFNELKGKGLIAEAGQAPMGMQLIDAPGLPKPRPFNDPVSGMQIQGAYYAKPDVANKLNQMFGDQSPKGGFEKGLKKAAGFSSTMQDFGLSGGVPGTPINAFTIAQGTKEVLSGNFKSPFVATMKSFTAEGSNKYFAKHAQDIAEMQSKGIPVRSDFSIDAKTLARDFADASGLKGKAKAVWEHAFNDPTFQRFMPILQTEMYKKVKAKYGPDVAAEAVRNFYGITDMATQATRSRAGNDFVTATLFAPKYRESMVNFWKQNAKALGNPTDPAYRANLKFVTGAAMSYAAMDYLNQYYNDGAHMWDNPDGKKDKALTVTIGGKQVGVPFLSSIATVPRNVASLGVNLATGNLEQAKKDAGSFLGYGIRPIADVLNNENYFGSQVANPNDSTGKRLKDVGAYLAGQYNHPYVREGINAVTGKNKSTAETVSKASELPFRFYDPAYYKYGGKGLNKDQRAELPSVPQGGKKEFIKSSIERNALVAKANDQKKKLRADGSTEIKKLPTGEYYAKVGKVYKTFQSEQDAQTAIEKYGSRKTSTKKVKAPSKKSSGRKSSGRGKKVAIPKMDYTGLAAKSSFNPSKIKAPKVSTNLKKSGGVNRRAKVKVRVA